MTIPEFDIYGAAFSQRDLKLLESLLRPDGTDDFGVSVAATRSVLDQIRYATRLAKRLGGSVWTAVHGGTRRFGIHLKSSS